MMTRIARISTSLLGKLRLASSIGCLSLFLAQSVLAQSTGRSLDIQPGARENGMGAAGVALIGDPSDAVWWNPAALGFAHEITGQFTYAELLPGLAKDLRYYYGSAAVPLGSRAGFGAGFTYLSYGKSYFGIGTYSRREYSPSASVGLRVLPDLSLGVTLKYVDIHLTPGPGSEEGHAFGTDLGALYRFPAGASTLSFGVTAQNLGPKVKFINEDQASPLGRNLKAGLAYQIASPIDENVEVGGVVVGDFNQSLVTHDFQTWNGGAEVYIGHPRLFRFAVRAGYYYDDLGDIRDMTFGVGARVLGLSFDAGWIPQARNTDLDRVLKLTGGINFNLMTVEP